MAIINVPEGTVTTVNGTAVNDTIYGSTGNDNIYGNAGDDTLYGGEGNDNLRGGEGSDRLFGGEGDDFLDGGTGSDYMAGGVGNDTYVVDDKSDVIVELANEGIDTVKSFINYTLRPNVENLELQGIADLSGSGNDLNNTIKGNSGNNSLHGGAGNDSLSGGLGDDVLTGGTGNDYINGGDGVDIASYKDAASGVTVNLSITSGQNTGGSGKDTLLSIENLEGSQFNDFLTGNAGDNKIIGLAGSDVIRGGAGNDDLTGGIHGDAFVFENVNNGIDTIRGFQSGVDTLNFSAPGGWDISGFAIDGNQLSYNGTLLANIFGDAVVLTDIHIA